MINFKPQQHDQQAQGGQVGLETKEEIKKIVTESIQQHLARDKEDNERSFAEMRAQIQHQRQEIEDRQLQIEEKQKKAEDVSCVIGLFVNCMTSCLIHFCV